MNILILGGGGYVGTPLTEKLLKNKKNKITVVDTFWFGNYLKKNKRLKIIKKDIREANIKWFKKIDSVIHLANIANDPAVDLNPSLSWDVNVIGLMNIMRFAIKNKVKKFIFASSGSIYGVKKEKKVTEDLIPVPISTYNKTKMISERVLESFSKYIDIYSIRPATVCGYSPRMRLDVSVNMFAYQALKFKKIKIFGGKQIRPNIHINDLINVYEDFLKKKLKTGIYNAGFENLKIIDIAKLVQKHIPCDIEILKDSNDPRTYRQNSEKLLNTGFIPRFKVEDAIKEIKEKFLTGHLNESDNCYTVKWMKKLKVK